MPAILRHSFRWVSRSFWQFALEWSRKLRGVEVRVKIGKYAFCRRCVRVEQGMLRQIMQAQSRFYTEHAAHNDSTTFCASTITTLDYQESLRHRRCSVATAQA